MMLHCNKAEKHGNLCLGYGTEGGEPCEICKNCIKCESGYYQLGETKKNDQLTKAKDLLKQWLQTTQSNGCNNVQLAGDTEQFLKEE